MHDVEGSLDLERQLESVVFDHAEKQVAKERGILLQLGTVEELSTQYKLAKDRVHVYSKKSAKEGLDNKKKDLTTALCDVLKKLYSDLNPVETVLLSRSYRRLQARDLIRLIATEFTEVPHQYILPRCKSDPALFFGWAKIPDTYQSSSSLLYDVAIIAHDKGGKEPRNRHQCNAGMAHPEGYKLARRFMEMAERCHKPIITLVDTPGAAPDLQSEYGGIAREIAFNLKRMPMLQTPTFSLVLNEGGSGGALGISGIPDTLLMLSNAYYSVITPEGCAAILWKNERPEFVATATEELHLTAKDLKQLRIIDDVIQEGLGGSGWSPLSTGKAVHYALVEFLRDKFHYTWQGAMSECGIEHANGEMNSILRNSFIARLKTLLEVRYHRIRHMTDFAVVEMTPEEMEPILQRQREIAAMRPRYVPPDMQGVVVRVASVARSVYHRIEKHTLHRPPKDVPPNAHVSPKGNETDR